MAREKSILAKTLEDHLKTVDSMTISTVSAPQPLIGTSGVTLAETMDDAALREYVARAVKAIEEIHKEAWEGDPDPVRAFKKNLSALLRDFSYLRKIGRLPKEFADLNPRQRFRLTEPRKKRRGA